jgi:2-hydroxychromene-2-carboxylate isomerase
VSQSEEFNKVPAHVDFHFDFSCPYAYLASEVIEATCARLGATLAWRPMLLGGVFRAIGDEGGPMSRQAAIKTANTVRDALLWAERREIPLAFPAAHPMRTVRTLRVLLGLPETVWPAAIHAIYRAYWRDGADVTRDDVIAAALAGAGIDATAALAGADDRKDELRRRTDEAVALGVFGAPAMFVTVDGRAPVMLWGQDRLHWLEAVIRGWRPDEDSPAEQIPAVPPRGATEPVDLWFDFSSPFAYLASTQIERIRPVRWRPLLLGGLFKSIGTVDVPLFAMPEVKRRYITGELQRWARWWGVPFRWPAKFPMRTVDALRVVIAADDPAIIHRLFRAAWVDGQDLGDGPTLRALVGDALVDRTREPAIKQALADSTAEAQRLGVFGVPTFAVGEQLIWGQDRIDLLR